MSRTQSQGSYFRELGTHQHQADEEYSVIVQSHAPHAAHEVTPRSVSSSLAKEMTTVPFNSRTRYASFGLRISDSKNGCKLPVYLTPVTTTTTTTMETRVSQRNQKQRHGQPLLASVDSRPVTESTTSTSAHQGWQISSLTQAAPTP